MTIYTRIEIGVSCRLALNYKNIELIHKLFNIRDLRKFIYGFLESDYLEYGNYDNDIKDNFDSGILDELVECINEEEFKLKAANLAEILTVNESNCETYYFLRRRKEFADLEDDDYRNFLSISEKICISEKLCDDEEDEYIEKIDLNERQISFEFFKKCYDIHTQCSGYSDYGTSYSSNIYSLKQLSQKNKSAINFFKNYNIDVDSVSCCLELNYQNIGAIHKLFKTRCTIKYIHGFLESDSLKYGDYESDIKDNFDSGILDELVECQNEEEFKLKAANLAEIRTIKESSFVTYYFLRRRKEFADLEDDDYRNFLDISEKYIDEFDGDEDDEDTQKINLNEKKISFEFFYENSDDKDSDDEYFSKDSLDEIQNGINFFKEFGIHGDEVKISKYLFFES